MVNFLLTARFGSTHAEITCSRHGADPNGRRAGPMRKRAMAAYQPNACRISRRTSNVPSVK